MKTACLNWLLLLLLLLWSPVSDCAEVFSWGHPYAKGTKQAARAAATTPVPAFTNLPMPALHPGIVVWDNFSGPDTDFVGFGQRKLNRIPDGQPYPWYWVDSGDGASNNISMQSGSWGWTFGTPSMGACTGHGAHIVVSNTTAGMAWTRIGGVVHYTNTGNLNGCLSASPMLLAAGAASPEGFYNFLHIVVAHDSAVLQYNVREDILRFNFPTALEPGVKYPVECQVISNTAILTVGGWTFSGTHSNLWMFGSTNRLASWEVYGASDNRIVFRWDAIWAGYADTALLALASRGRTLETNLTLATASTYKPTLINNFITNTITDQLVGIGLGVTETGTAITNYLFSPDGQWGTMGFGRQIMIYDAALTAAGTNIWIVCPPGLTINGGLSETNISVNGGAYTFISTPTGWNIVGKSP
jgi:hypothetical protein